MTEDPNPAASPSVALDELLLDAKVSVPQPRSGAVSRASLIETARASDCRVVGITAPAGYGKSTMLVEWASAEDRRVAWVSLDRLDDDPAVLLTLLAAAYTRISLGNANLIADVGGPGVSVLGRAAPRLASVFRTSPVPFVFMLDDLHELRSPACHDVLSVVISGIPRDSQLVAASRSEQPHLPRLRASGDAMEFVASDLALDAAGAVRIFSEMNVRVTPQMADAVTERTEGWPVGMYLAAMIARGSNGEALSISGDDRYVADYLYRESLLQLPESVHRFLRCTAVLDELCAPLCDAVLQESGSQDVLRSLEAASSFLIPLDRRREWYRYHALFREFLLGELRRVEPDLITKLHLRAADWYESNGSPALAVEHLLNTSERDRCVQLVTALVLPTYQAGHMSTVQRWLSALGDAAIEEYPPLAVLAGWVAALTGQVTRSATMGGDRRRRFIRPGTHGRLCIVRLGSGNVAVDDVSRRPRAGHGRRQPRRRPGAPVERVARRGARHMRRGASAHRRHRPGCGPVRRVPPIATVNSNTDSIALAHSELALMAMDDGRWAEAAEHLDLALGAIDEHRMEDYATSVLAFAGAARYAVHRGELKEANRQLTRAMRARPTTTVALPYLAVRLRLQLAKVYWALADRTTARHLLREIDDILLHRPALGALVDQVSDFRQFSPRARRWSYRRIAPHPGRASPPPLPADAPHDSGDRGAAVRVPQHRQLAGQLDLSKTGGLVTQRRRGASNHGGPARRLTELTPRIRRHPRCRTRAPSPASGRLRRRKEAQRWGRCPPTHRRSRRRSRRH